MYEALSEDGYKIEEVDNGPAALEAIKASEHDMVLLDVKMPRMSGFEVCSEIRRLTGDTKISIVMVTGLDDSASIEKAFQLGATAFVSKPINWDTFPYRIQYLLKARNAIVALKQREVSLQHTERISRVLTQSKNKETLLKGILHEMLDIFSALVLMIPLLLPVAIGYGVDPVHLGIIFLANMQIGYFTPPVGMNLFIASYRFKKPVMTIYRATLPWFLILFTAVLNITYWPGFSLVLLK